MQLLTLLSQCKPHKRFPDGDDERLEIVAPDQIALEILETGERRHGMQNYIALIRSMRNHTASDLCSVQHRQVSLPVEMLFQDWMLRCW